MLGAHYLVQGSRRPPAQSTAARPTRPRVGLSTATRRKLPLAPFAASARFAAEKAGLSQQQTMDILRREKSFAEHVEPWSDLLQLVAKAITAKGEDLFALWNSDLGANVLTNGAYQLGLESTDDDEKSAAATFGSLCDQRKTWLVLDGLNDLYDPNAWPFFHAQRRRHPDWVMPQPACPIQWCDADGADLLHWAARKCPADFQNFLIEEGVPPLALDHTGNSALHEACRYQSEAAHFEPVVDLLLGHGIAINAVGPEGATPLHVAAARGSGLWCAVLLARGADPRIRDGRGRTALECVPNRDSRGARACLQALALNDALAPASIGPPRIRL